MARYFLDPKTNELTRINAPKDMVDLDARVETLLNALNGAKENDDLSANKAVDIVDSFISDVGSLTRAQVRIDECLAKGLIEVKVRDRETAA